MGILSTSVSGLQTAQRVLSVTSHNVANVNTPGYSRQVLKISAREPNFVGNGFIGTGAQVIDISRVHNEFVSNQVRTSTSSVFEAKAYLGLAERVDKLLAGSNTGLGSAIQDFFSATNELANVPSSATAKQVMLNEADALVSRFRFLDSKLTNMLSDTRQQLDSNINEINSLALSLADMNARIVVAIGQSNGQMPNDLLDQRDQLIEQLSQQISVTTQKQDDGALNIFVGSGQPLVLGIAASQLDITETYEGHFDIRISNAFNSTIITNGISGGSISGILRFQTEILEPAINALGNVAIGLADSFNSQHQLGLTINGNMGGSFFNVATPEISVLGTALANVTATITNSSQLSGNSYSLIYNGADNYILTDLKSGNTTAINTGGAYPFTTASIDGFSINIASVAAAVGDRYIIRPTAGGASDISVLINDASQIASANPLISGVATNSAGVPTNVGDADISAIEITTATGLPLASNITLTFNSALNQFAISAPPGGTLAYNPSLDSNGKQFTIAAAGGATFIVSGRPVNGDVLDIKNNVNPDGDGTNMLKLASLQSQSLLLNGTASYENVYGQMVAGIGSDTRQASISSEALSALLNQSIEARESLSGVNLDEEAANMLIFQQAYQAAAQLITTANTIFQALINAI